MSSRISSRRRHLLFDVPMCEKCLDLRVHHVLWVMIIMKGDVSFNPANVTLASAAGIVFELYCIRQLVKELLWPHFRVRGIHGDS